MQSARPGRAGTGRSSRRRGARRPGGCVAGLGLRAQRHRLLPPQSRLSGNQTQRTGEPARGPGILVGRRDPGGRLASPQPRLHGRAGRRWGVPAGTRPAEQHDPHLGIQRYPQGGGPPPRQPPRLRPGFRHPDPPGRSLRLAALPATVSRRRLRHPVPGLPGGSRPGAGRSHPAPQGAARGSAHHPPLAGADPALAPAGTGVRPIPHPGARAAARGRRHPGALGQPADRPGAGAQGELWPLRDGQPGLHRATLRRRRGGSPAAGAGGLHPPGGDLRAR